MTSWRWRIALAAALPLLGWGYGVAKANYIAGARCATLDRAELEAEHGPLKDVGPRPETDVWPPQVRCEWETTDGRPITIRFPAIP